MPVVEDEHAVVQAQAAGEKHVSVTAATVTAHAKAGVDQSPDYFMPPPEKTPAPREARRSVDQGLMAPMLHVAVPDMPNLKPLMAMSISRSYTGALGTARGSTTTAANSRPGTSVHMHVASDLSNVPSWQPQLAATNC